MEVNPHVKEAWKVTKSGAVGECMAVPDMTGQLVCVCGVGEVVCEINTDMYVDSFCVFCQILCLSLYVQ